uniref:Uncharacterized protein n=1 Tax=Tanacetum cinerariifolium TaxID=118510 RepID=A0A6L2MU16_TANCI|nr:hypothetical protein [Tanacetum cinerariifolium]
MGFQSVEERLEFFKKNKFIHLEDIKVLKVEIQMKEIAIKELRRKLEIAQKEKDRIQLAVDKVENASKGLNKLIECQIVDYCKKGLGYENYNAVPPPYIGNFMPPIPDLSYTGLDEFASKPVAENVKAKSSQGEANAVRKNNDAPIIEEWVSDDEEDNVTQPKIQKKTVRPTSPGNTFSDPSKDLSNYLLASLAISPFHDDPYMKVMQAYNATSNESPIPPQAPIAPPTISPSSSM